MNYLSLLPVDHTAEVAHLSERVARRRYGPNFGSFGDGPPISGDNWFVTISPIKPCDQCGTEHKQFWHKGFGPSLETAFEMAWKSLTELWALDSMAQTQPTGNDQTTGRVSEDTESPNKKEL